jgi:hypothetical protein
MWFAPIGPYRHYRRTQSLSFEQTLEIPLGFAKVIHAMFELVSGYVFDDVPFKIVHVVRKNVVNALNALGVMNWMIDVVGHATCIHLSVCGL